MSLAAISDHADTSAFAGVIIPGHGDICAMPALDAIDIAHVPRCWFHFRNVKTLLIILDAIKNIMH